MARIARGKANELLVRQYAESLGLKPGTEEKSYRQHDHFDFEISGSQGDILADVKTFHVLDMFIEPPRKSFSIEDLLNSVSSSEEGWYNFYPMLIPQDYRQFKDIYLFGASVEEKSAPLKDRTADFPVVRFFSICRKKILSAIKAGFAGGNSREEA